MNPVPKRTGPTNLYLAALMDAPSVPRTERCPVCGCQPTESEHHIVPRAQGGHDGPTVYLCGHGTRGCHGAAEDRRLHFAYRSGHWVFRVTDLPTKYEAVLAMPNWRRL